MEEDRGVSRCERPDVQKPACAVYDAYAHVGAGHRVRGEGVCFGSCRT